MKIPAIVSITLVLFSCKSAPDQQQANASSSNDSTVFFPVHEYFAAEMKDIDSTPYFLYKITEHNGLRDSTTISKKQLDEWAKPFLQINTNDASFKKNYTENVFNDVSTNSITLTYSAKDKALPVQSIEVLLKNDNQQVKRIFISSVYNHGDTVIINKMGWKTGESFYINRSKQLQGTPDQSEANSIIWNRKQEK